LECLRDLSSDWDANASNASTSRAGRSDRRRSNPPENLQMCHVRARILRAEDILASEARTDCTFRINHTHIHLSNQRKKRHLQPNPATMVVKRYVYQTCPRFVCFFLRNRNSDNSNDLSEPACAPALSMTTTDGTRPPRRVATPELDRASISPTFSVECSERCDAMRCDAILARETQKQFD